MKISLKPAFSIVGGVVVLFATLSVFVAHSTSVMMVDEAERTVKSVVKETTGRIDRLMTVVEAATVNSAWIVGEHLDDPDYMYRITRELVENNDFIVGSTVAFEPDFFKAKGRLYSPYSCIDKKGKISSFPLPYDYPTYEWYRGAKEAGRPRWCEPYFDEGGGGIMMCTFSVPIRDGKGRFYAVLTADISLEQLTRHVAAICPYPRSYAELVSGKGEYIVKPPQGREAAGLGDTIAIRDQAQNGWALSIVCPVENILSGARRLVFRIVIFAALGLVLIFLLSWFYSSRLQRATVQRERIEGELGTARAIQEGVLTKDFPENVAATLLPAREVGGDLYDVVRRGNRLYFIVGDASGKGVPAALFSFMAGTVFRMACGMDLAANEIAARINRVLASSNKTSMFVTAFVGVLDVTTGDLDFCCAGHNPPVVISPDGAASFLAVRRGPPTGAVAVASYEPQRTKLERGAKILVYTDGVTEAERADHSQFGNGRLLEYASGCGGRGVCEVLDGLVRSVDEFVAGARQFDDITIMVVGC